LKILCASFLAAMIGWMALAAEGETRPRVLVITGGRGFQREPFFKMFSDNPEITFTSAEHV